MGIAFTRNKVQDMNDLRQHLIDVRVGMECSITDDIDQWRRRL